jgi:hypothetical protein
MMDDPPHLSIVFHQLLHRISFLSRLERINLQRRTSKMSIISQICIHYFEVLVQPRSGRRQCTPQQLMLRTQHLLYSIVNMSRNSITSCTDSARTLRYWQHRFYLHHTQCLAARRCALNRERIGTVVHCRRWQVKRRVLSSVDIWDV